MSAAFDRNEALQFGWRAMKQNLGFFLAWIGIDAGASLLFGGIKLLAAARVPALPVATSLMDFILHLVVGLGVLSGALAICDGRRPRVSDLFGATSRLWSYLGVSLLLGLMLIATMALPMLAAGLVTLAVASGPHGLFGFGEAVLISILLGGTAAIAVMVKYGLAEYLVVDGAGARTALRASARITDGHRGDLLVFFLATFGMNLLGLICLGVGLLVTMPTTIVAHAWVYRQLRARFSTTSSLLAA
jgi:uncharacterized membrane protein